MKYIRLSRTATAAGIILLGCLCVAYAQPDRNNRPGRRAERPEAQPDRPERPPGPGQMAPGRPAGLERVFTVLTPEQRQSLREVMGSVREKNQELEPKIREARKQMLDLALADNFREDAVRKKAMEIAKFEAERVVATAKAFSKVQPPLTPEQIDKIKSARPMDPGARLHQREQMDRPGRDRDGNDLPRRERPPKRDRDEAQK